MAPTKRRTVENQGRCRRKVNAFQARVARQRKASSAEAMPGPVRKRGPMSKKTKAVMAAVFNTIELLENILLHVPFRSLAICQRVCTEWRDAITGSIPIKQKLFLSVDEAHQRWAIVGNTLKDLHFIRITPTMILPPPTSIPDPLAQFWSEPGTSPQQVLPVRLHPLLQHQPPPFWRVRGAGDENTSAQELLFSKGIHVELLCDLHGYAARASWRGMYLSNPPCTKVNAQITFETNKSPVHSVTTHVKIEEATGITFGLLVDRALEAEITNKGGKKCSSGHGPTGAAVEHLEALDKRRAWIERSGSSVGTEIFLDGVVAPSEEEWEAVAKPAT